MNQTHREIVYLFIAGMSNKKTANMRLLEFCHQGDSVGIAQFVAEEGVVHQEAEG